MSESRRTCTQCSTLLYGTQYSSMNASISEKQERESKKNRNQRYIKAILYNSSVCDSSQRSKQDWCRAAHHSGLLLHLHGTLITTWKQLLSKHIPLFPYMPTLIHFLTSNSGLSFWFMAWVTQSMALPEIIYLCLCLCLWCKVFTRVKP